MEYNHTEAITFCLWPLASSCSSQPVYLLDHPPFLMDWRKETRLVLALLRRTFPLCTFDFLKSSSGGHQSSSSVPPAHPKATVCAVGCPLKALWRQTQLCLSLLIWLAQQKSSAWASRLLCMWSALPPYCIKARTGTWQDSQHFTHNLSQWFSINQGATDPGVPWDPFKGSARWHSILVLLGVQTPARFTT